MRYPTPELAAEWRKKLADSGFDDHEDEWGNLRDERARHDMGYMVEVKPDVVPSAHLGDETKTDRFRVALYRYPFKHKIDRAICEKLATGHSILAIIEDLDVGQARVYRVMQTLLAWSDPGECLFGPEIPS